MDIVIGDRTWKVDLDDRIGRGCFGGVYAAAADGEEGVVKLVPKASGAQRELLFADDLSGVPNVVPVYGVGETEDSWAIVMPRADQSLRDFMGSVGGALSQDLVLPILLDVAAALVSLEQNGVVHRDLKPDNILLLDGRWCLTDFGISRYAEATTAPDTRKFSMTPQYAAPEQWRLVQATSATDIYAFGITAFELLAGVRPFNGPDFRKQHIEEPPPQLTASISTSLRGIVEECLIKAPQARPAPQRLVTRLSKQMEGQSPGTGAAALIEAQQREVARIGEEARRTLAAQVETERRAELFAAAKAMFLVAERGLADYIHEHAPAASSGWPMRLGGAKLDLTAPTLSPAGSHLPFDVIANAEIRVDQAAFGGGSYVGRMHSLWYCDAQEKGRYAWYETAYMRHPLMQKPGAHFDVGKLFEPFSSSPNDEIAEQALSMGMGTYQVAWPFTPLLDDELDGFVERWATWFAQASDGRLAKPSTMPERNVYGSWR
jgi:hypothetical protein